ncbi:hypothetical protein [Streptomyces niveus]|uniref:Secreted protein n=1 Tax=Streptomyces niveus TaxID=193462 RepID=A0A1U9QNN6_STRNV|nr:hypothetical protein [Streptomyces niveus]AQU65882.1 hypothetical protein BBN63_06140 [Streptomyces niveus]
MNDRARSPYRRRAAAALSLLACAGVAVATPSAGAADGQKSTRVDNAPTTPATWSPDLTRVTSDDVNVRYAKGALSVRDTAFRPASAETGRGYGAQVLAPETLDAPVNRVGAELVTDLPGDSGAEVVVDVRGRTAQGAWTEWVPAGASGAAESAAGQGAAVLPRAVTTVQARITLWDAEGEARVRSLRLTAENVAAPRIEAGATAFTARVFATREGLVGGTTANGHVIRPNDHFVALPSRRGLSPNGSSQYSVQVCGPARCETAPVWDVGPWNTKDDYWNPSPTREMFKDLAQGMPEAQAAYQSGYNGGKDGSGRTVLNPAGIDLADGTFYNVGLNDNGWVTVTYLWTGDQTGKSFPTWGTDVRIRQQATTASPEVARLAGPTTVNVKCQVHGQRITVDGITNDGWAYLPSYGGYISNIFIDVVESWLPGVPNC